MSSGHLGDASWAIRFYTQHGFTIVSHKESDRLLRKYWRIPERQIATSIVLQRTRPDSPAPDG